MYLKKIELKNTGPIDHIEYTLPFDGEKPIPVIFVGTNGTGKTILLSYIVNAMVTAKGAVFDDVEIVKGKIYKLRDPQYIRHGQWYYRAELIFSDGFVQSELQILNQVKEHVSSSLKDELESYKEWKKMKNDENSYYSDNFYEKNKEKSLKYTLLTSSLLYFPPNRFEEPSWLNSDNLLNSATYLSIKPIQGLLNRKIINYSPLKENERWLLDVLYDSLAIDRTTRMINLPNNLNVPILQQNPGLATNIRNEIEIFFRKLFQKNGQVNWNVGSRGRRKISINIGNNVLTNNLFGLSTGQTALLNIFLTIIRDADLSDAKITSLKNIKGLVVVDEIDLHLHSDLQYNVLPELIKLFPKIQFILTTHSPLFLMGMNKCMGSDRFDIIDLPSGTKVDVEHFCEFTSAYQHFKKSIAFEDDIKRKIKESQKNILFLEGETDKDYITEAAELLGEKSLLEKFNVIEASGFGSLDKIWKHFNTKLSDAIHQHQKIILLYDCDRGSDEQKVNKIYKQKIPEQQSIIKKGIENLFPESTIRRASEANNNKFIDITDEHKKKVRGEQKSIPEQWEINKDEKRNLCTWLCKNGTKEDFSSFQEIFQILRKIIDEPKKNHE